MHIRLYNNLTDLEQLRECLIELQDCERHLDPRMPAGANIVDAYIPQMFEQCHECQGEVFVVEVDGSVAGYVTILTKVKSQDVDDGDIEFGLIADLVVRAKLRGRGLGRKLLEAAETHARLSGVKWLRISVLAQNHKARNLYSSMGYSELCVELEKDLNHL